MKIVKISHKKIKSNGSNLEALTQRPAKKSISTSKNNDTFFT